MPVIPSALNPAETKDRLIVAAGKLFADLGFTAVSIREIAAEAGVHFSLVNYHFGSKRELYRAALAAAITCPDHQTKMQMLDQIEQPEDLLLAIATHIMGSYDEEGYEAWKVKLINNELQAEKPDWELLTQYWGPGVTAVEHAISKIRGLECPTVEDRLTTVSFFMAVDQMGMNLRHLRPDNPIWGAAKVGPDQMAKHVVNIFINGIKARPGQG